MRVCLKCGAVSDGLVCEYCHAPFTENEPDTIDTTINYSHDPVPVPITPIPMPEPQSVATPPQQETSDKNWWTALLLCIFVGIFGAHRFYAGKTGTGVIWLFTLGCVGYGWIIDMVLIVLGKFKDDQGRRIIRL